MMSISQHEIALRLTPPAAEGEAYDRKVTVSEAAEKFAAAVLATVPGSREQRRSVEMLEACVHWAYSGIDRRLDPDAHPVPAQPEALIPGPPDADGRSPWGQAVIDSDLPGPHRLLALVLACYIDPVTGAIPDEEQPTLRALRRATRMDLAQLWAVLRDLERLGWLRRDPPAVASGPSRYVLTLPAPSPEPA